MKDKQSSKTPQAYHHGNLKQALIDTYLDMLCTTSPEKISLRKIAQQLGVAATAVYNHFEDKNALTCAARARCLHHFADFLESTFKDTNNPEQNISQLGKSYFRYSLEHPEMFKIIFQKDHEEDQSTDELIAAGMHAEELLRHCVIALLEYHKIPTTQYNEGLGAFACWSMAHGVTTLAALQVNTAACMHNRWPKEFLLNSEESVDAVFDAMNQVLVAGILNAAKK